MIKTDRRKFLWSGIAGALVGPNLQMASALDPPRERVGNNNAEVRSASKQRPKLVRVTGGLRCVARLPDGHLMTYWVEGENPTSESINNPDIVKTCYARYSTDNGNTWSERQRLFDFPAGLGAYEGGVMLVDRTGVIHLFGFHYFGCGPGEWENWESCKNLVFHVMSTDGGKAWTAPHYCNTGYGYTGAINSVIQLSTGRILIAVSCLSGRMTGRFITRVTLSDDGGRSWRPSRGECVVDGGGHWLESGADEPVCLELRDGVVWMSMRTTAGFQYDAFSYDKGDTWTEPQPSHFVSSNSPGALLRLKDGRIVFVWNNCMGPESREGIIISYDRQILAAAISNDEGKTWQGYREILRIESGLWQVSYPWLTEAADGAIICSGIAGRDFFPEGLVRFGADWLTTTTFKDEFKNGLANWVTFGCEGVSAAPHPERAGAQVLAFEKPNAEVPAGASLNFPFGVRGSARIRLRFDPAVQKRRQHYYVTLSEFFCLPRLPYSPKNWGGWGLFPAGERFMLRVAPDGLIEVAMRQGLFQTEYRRTKAQLDDGRWCELELRWDCKTGSCLLNLEGQQVAVMPQISAARGLCYLRLWASADVADYQRMLIESVDIEV